MTGIDEVLRCIGTISTHTLTWSVTIQNARFIKFTVISTHTLTWSVTPSEEEYIVKLSDFNSHAHVERDC